MSKLRGNLFVVGNKAGRGRPKGSRNKARIEAPHLLKEYAEALTRACIDLALKGNVKAMQICMDRIAPAPRDPRVGIRLGPTSTASEIAAAGERVVRGIGSGKITPAEAEKVTNILEHRRKIIDTIELDNRVLRLEHAQAALDQKAS